MFRAGGKANVVYPEMWLVIATMLKFGVGEIAAEHFKVQTSSKNDEGSNTQAESSGTQKPTPKRRRSLSLDTQLGAMTLACKSAPYQPMVYRSLPF